MGKFVMTKYLNNDTKDLEVNEPVVREVTTTDSTDGNVDTPVTEKDTRREIKISSVKNTPISEIVTRALNDALRIDGMSLIHDGELTNNELFKDIRIVSMEDINNDLPGSIRALEEGDLVLMDMKMPKTPKEKLFDLKVMENQDKVFNNPVKLAERLINESKDIEVTEVANQVYSANVGDEVEYNGHTHLVIFKDKHVIILRLHGYRQICTSDSHVILDMPKSVLN